MNKKGFKTNWTSIIFVCLFTAGFYQNVWKIEAKVQPEYKFSGKEYTKGADFSLLSEVIGTNVDWLEILAQQRNVSAEVTTAGCPSKCRTAIALWVLQNLQPCGQIKMADCPLGMVCCIQTPESSYPKGYVPTLRDTLYEGLSDEGLHSNDDIPPPSPDIFVPYVDHRDQIYYPEPILDPIPNDESFEILKV